MDKKKKIIIIASAVCLLFTLVFVVYRTIREKTLFEQTDLYSVVSSRAAIIVESNDMVAFSKALLYENDYWKITDSIDLFADFNQYIKNIDVLYTKNQNLPLLSERPILIVYNLSENKKITAPFIALKCTKSESESFLKLFHQTVFPSLNIETIKHSSTKINLFAEKSQTRYATAFINGVLVGSASLSEVQKAIELAEKKSSLLNHKSFFSVKKTAGKTAIANLFVNLSKVTPVCSSILNENYPILRDMMQHYAEWVGLDVNVSGERLLVNGYSTINPTYYSAIFEGQEAVSTDLCRFLPINTCFFTHYGISDYSRFVTQLQQQNRMEISVENTLNINFVEQHFNQEIILATADADLPLNKSTFVMLAVKDSLAVNDFLEKNAKKESYRSSFGPHNIDVFEMPAGFSFTQAFGKRIELKEKEYTTLIGNSLLITTSAELLLDLAGKMKVGYNLSKNANFSFIQESYNSKSSVLVYLNIPQLIRFSKQIFEPSFAAQIDLLAEKLSPIQSIGFQLENERGMMYQSLFLKSGNLSIDSIPTIKKTHRVVWKIPFEEKIQFGPVMVSNKGTGYDEILIQDIHHQLYFYSHDGKLLWKAQIEGPIMSKDIAQIDYYGNRKYQLVFNTKKNIHVIDRKGRMLLSFPKKIAEASAPLSVFDYDGNLDYRIVIPTTDKKINMYNKDGKTVQGWNPSANNTTMTSAIQHLRTQGKDYLLTHDGKSMYILDRKGFERVRLNKNIVPSPNNKFYLQLLPQGVFLLATDKDGDLHKISFDGNVFSQKISEKLSENHTFLYTQFDKRHMYIFTDEHKLSIHNQDLKCIFFKKIEEKDLLPSLYKNLLALYAPEKQKVYLYNLADLDLPEMIFNSQAFPYLGQLKPMPNNYLLTQEAQTLICYELIY